MKPETKNALRSLLRSNGPAYLSEEIAKLERSHRTQLPVSYWRFLEEIGPGKITWRPDRRPLEFDRLEAIEARYASMFDDPSWCFGKYLPIGADEELQELYVFALERPDGRNFARIWHETVADDWDEEPWGSFDDWLAFLGVCDGHIDPP